MLEFQNVTIHQNKRKILDNFSLNVQDGSILGMIGPDRQAKSAILRSVVGIAKPSMGKIRFYGKNVRENDEVFLKTGYLPYDCQFYDQLTVEEYLELFLAFYKVNGRYRSRRVDDVLDFLEMDEYRDSYIGELSGEMKVFLCLGKTIVHDPSWLLLEDPFGKLSLTLRKKMLDCLMMLWEQGKTLIISTQLFPELTSFFKDIAVFENGQMVANGTIQSIYSDALRESPIRMKVISGMDEAIAVLRKNDLVERVTVDGEDVILLFSGGEKEEAELLRQLVQAGVMIHHFMRDPMDLDQFMWGGE